MYMWGSRLQVQALPGLGCVPLVLFQLLKNQWCWWRTGFYSDKLHFSHFLTFHSVSFLWGWGPRPPLPRPLLPHTSYILCFSKGKGTGLVSDPVGDKRRSYLLPAVDDTAAGQPCGLTYLWGCNFRISPAKKAITAHLPHEATAQEVTISQRRNGVMFSAAQQFVLRKTFFSRRNR